MHELCGTWNIYAWKFVSHLTEHILLFLHTKFHASNARDEAR